MSVNKLGYELRNIVFANKAEKLSEERGTSYEYHYGEWTYGPTIEGRRTAIRIHPARKDVREGKIPMNVEVLGFVDDDNCCIEPLTARDFEKGLDKLIKEDISRYYLLEGIIYNTAGGLK